MDMAKSLISNMTERWQPDAITDEYTGRLEKVIAAKVKSGGKGSLRMAASKSAQVINLMEAFAQSLKEAGKKPKRKNPKP